MGHKCVSGKSKCRNACRSRKGTCSICKLGESDNQYAEFMQDLTPCNKTKSVFSFFNKEKVVEMDCPIQTLHLRPITYDRKAIGECYRVRKK